MVASLVIQHGFSLNQHRRFTDTLTGSWPARAAEPLSLVATAHRTEAVMSAQYAEEAAAHHRDFYVDLEGDEKRWEHGTITTAQVRELAGWPADQPIVLIDRYTNEETPWQTTRLSNWCRGKASAGNSCSSAADGPHGSRAGPTAQAVARPAV